MCRPLHPGYQMNASRTGISLVIGSGKKLHLNDGASSTMAGAQDCKSEDLLISVPGVAF